MYCLSAGPSTILEGSANRVGEPSAVGGGIKVFFTGTIYDDAAFEQEAGILTVFNTTRSSKANCTKTMGPARISTDPQCRL
jgi:hypothetical protein